MDQELQGLADIIRTQPLAAVFSERGTSDLIEDMKQSPNLYREFEAYLQRHEHREIDNLLDMYYPALGERGDTVIENLKLLIGNGRKADSSGSEAGRYRGALLETILSCPVEFRSDLLELIELTRTYIVLDDTERYETTRVHVPLRRGLLALGEKFVLKGLLGEPGDIFFGRFETIEEAVSSGDYQKFAEEVRVNKRSFNDALGGFASQPSDRDIPSESRGESLEGLPCSPGYMEGTVCVVNAVDEFKKLRKGAILVARAAPPAWSPLFYVAGAIVTEAGGALSHGAILARELRLPAIMGVKGLLQQLRDGDRIAVDGSTGRLTRLV
jgi:phosphohistidine swiveling domain-containing protein